MLGHRLRAGDGQHLRRPVRLRSRQRWRRWFTLSAHGAGRRDHRLRIPRQRAAGVAAAGAARLPEHVREAGRGAAARRRASCSCGRELQLPAFTRFVDGTGPIFAGKIFPFCFITIACGAISGFHSLISSGTTPKMIAQGMARAGRSATARCCWKASSPSWRMIAACVAAAGRLLRGELAGRHRGRDAGRRGRHHHRLGLPGDRRARWQTLAQRRRRADAVLSHRRRAVAGARHGAHLRATRRRRGACSASGITSPSCSRRCSS